MWTQRAASPPSTLLSPVNVAILVEGRSGDARADVDDFEIAAVSRSAFLARDQD
jgi:hypothetical protein